MALGQQLPAGTQEGAWGQEMLVGMQEGAQSQDSPGPAEPTSQSARQADSASSVCGMRRCPVELSFPEAARSRAAGCCIPCALLTEIVIYAIRSVRNKEFQRGSHFASVLQRVSANSSAAVCSA